VRTPLDLIACPVCHAALEPSHSGALCPDCGRDYHGGHGIDLTPVPPPDPEVMARWALWEKLQANFSAAAAAVPEHSLSVTVRPDADAFASFCGFAGTVLDVGCGTQPLPTYAEVDSCRFVGIDPLPGSDERGFEFVQGLGEFLPFRTGVFDQVLFATSLDHMLVPRRALADARRVLRPGGAVNVWFGEIDRPAPPEAVPARARRLARARDLAGGLVSGLRAETPPEAEETEPAYIAALEQPEGAIDKFHVAHPGVQDIERWFDEVGLDLGSIERVDFANGCFIRGLKPR
jgi:SAM-dependent methyltransferase